MAEFEIRQWALKGAEQRLVEISEEAARIYATFPELRDGAGTTPTGVVRRGLGRPPKVAANGGDSTPAPRSRPKFSAAARKRIAEAQRKR